jgi:hypothetical protein
MKPLGWFVLGLILGIAGAVLVPKYAGPYLPAMLRPDGEASEGTVVAKDARDPAKLLLTIDTEQGAILATFTEKIAEIGLLVEVGDRVTMRLDAVTPFVDDPQLERVVKAEETPPTERAIAMEEALQGADEEPDTAIEAEDEPGAEEAEEPEGGAVPEAVEP